MVMIKKTMDTNEKLRVLSRDSRYDLACACATRQDEHRKRSETDKWIYPVTFPDGRRTFLFKTLLSNECVNNCKYCPLRAGRDVPRCGLVPEELARTFLSYYRARKVSGLFLSSGVGGKPDAVMDGINRTAGALRRSGFRGYIHLKIIPGASDAAVRRSLSLATAVSINVETATAARFRELSTTKDFKNDIVRPLKLISRLTARGGEFSRVKQTTQFVVGAASDTDEEIVKASWGLYRNLGLCRVYFSAYQRGAGASDLPGEVSGGSNADLLTREHRLYQVDWLMRKYGFTADEIPFGSGGKLSLECDPKEAWAKAHPEFFPVDVNRDEVSRLLRVPGFGEVTVEKIREARKCGLKIRSIEDLGRQTRILKKAMSYVVF
ncbi:MAG: radical SAM protein [Candidatus Omnitrophica bacterium]|nr:radical SAM protein [Candidatus Omnitrophota bacterium]MDD5487881.1 radical SAM protein [Candidatus Omnitrophota bacterium]